MFKITKFLAGIVAAGSVAYADDLPKIGKSSIRQVQAVPETPAQLPPTTKTPAPVVPMPAEPAAIPPSTMAVVESATTIDDPSSRFWAGAEYGIWRVQRGPVANPLLVFSPPGSVPAPVAGIPLSSTVLFGNDNIEFGNAPGLTATLGTWLSPERVIGIEGSFLSLRKQNVQSAFTSTSTGNLISIPYTAPNGAPRFILVSGLFSFSAGTTIVEMTNQFWGYDAKLVFAIDRTETSSLELVAGYRSLSLEESLVLTANINDIRAPGASSSAIDAFKTMNQFHGGQLGFRNKNTWRGFTFDAAGLLSMGVTQQTIDIFGERSTSVPFGIPNPRAFGILAQPTNIGITRQDQFSVVPEVNLKLSYNITQSIALSLGYQGIYWTNVIRPGNVIDSVMNLVPPALYLAGGLPPVPSGNPVPQKVSTDFWAQGILFGINVRY